MTRQELKEFWERNQTYRWDPPPGATLRFEAIGEGHLWSFCVEGEPVWSYSSAMDPPMSDGLSSLVVALVDCDVIEVGGEVDENGQPHARNGLLEEFEKVLDQLRSA